MSKRKRGSHSTVIDKKLTQWLRNFGGVSAGIIENTSNKTRKSRLEIHLEKTPIGITVRQTGQVQQLTFYLPSRNPKAEESNFRKEHFWKRSVIPNWVLKKYQVVRYEFGTDRTTVIKTEVNTEAEFSGESSTE